MAPSTSGRRHGLLPISLRRAGTRRLHRLENVVTPCCHRRQQTTLCHRDVMAIRLQLLQLVQLPALPQGSGRLPGGDQKAIKVSATEGWWCWHEPTFTAIVFVVRRPEPPGPSPGQFKFEFLQQQNRNENENDNESKQKTKQRIWKNAEKMNRTTTKNLG